MKFKWPLVRLGEILRRVERFEMRDEATEYPFAGTYSFARGIFVGERKAGSTFALPKIQRIKAGDFVYCKIMAWEGAFGLVPPAANGCVMSGAFVVYEPVATKIDPEFLNWYFKVPAHWEAVGRESTGTNVRRKSLHPSDFEAFEIPLPPINEQQRIVARIDALVAELDEARALRERAAEESEALMASALGAKFRALAEAFPVEPLGNLSSHILDGPHLTPQYLPQGMPGIPFVTVKNMVTGKLHFTDLNYVSEDDHRVFTKRCKPERGDVLYSKDGATRGRPCFVDTDREFSYFVSVALIKPLRDRLDGQFLVHLLNSNWIRDRMADKSRGDMIPHIVLREIRAFPVPILPLVEQRRIITQLDRVQAKVDTLKCLQAETSVELDALYPALLDKAFKGDV